MTNSEIISLIVALEVSCKVFGSFNVWHYVIGEYKNMETKEQFAWIALWWVLPISLIIALFVGLKKSIKFITNLK